jgi:hypothetical protein
MRRHIGSARKTENTNHMIPSQRVHWRAEYCLGTSYNILPLLLVNKEDQRKGKQNKAKVLTLNKYMAMGPSGARCQD